MNIMNRWVCWVILLFGI